MIKNYINNIEVSSPDSSIPSGLLKNLVVYKIYSQESISNEFEHRIFILIKGEIEKQSKTKVLDLGEKKLKITIDYGKNKSKRIITGIVADIINSGYIEYGGNVNYNYELVLVPPTIIYEDMEFKNKTYKEEKFEGLLDKIFNKSVISVNFKKNAEIFEEKFGDQINYNQINETNLHFFKKTMKLFGLNYYYEYSKGSYTCNVQENLAFGKEFKESSSIQLLENIILNKNLLQKKIRGYELDTSNDKWQEFVDKNINNLNAPKKVIKANCSDLSVDLSTIIKFPQKQFGQELKARIYKYNLVINKQIHSENIKGIENFDNVSMAFESIVEEQNVEYGYVGEMSILPIQTTNYSSSSSVATQDLALAKNSALNAEFRLDNIQRDSNKQKIPSTQTSIKDQLVIKKACVVENTDKNEKFNTFQAKVFEHVKGNFQLSEDTLTVNLTMPIGIDASFYRMPIENDIVLIVNIDGVWYLHSCLMEKIENNSKITTPKNMFIESTNEESNLKDMGDQCLWAYDYQITEGEQKNTYKRKGSSLSLGKVKDLQKYSLDYWKKRNLQDRKLKQYQTINSLFKELEKTDNFESSSKDENSKDEYIVNIDTEGLVNIDADENIFAQSGKDMYLTGENIYMSSIEGNVELRAEKSIVLKVGRSSLIITEEGISLNVIDTVSPSRNAVVSLSNMEGVMISGTEFSARGHFGAKLAALGGSVGVEGCIASIAAHKVYLSAPSAVSLAADGAVNMLNMLFDNIEGCSEEGNSFSDADQLEQIRMIALKIDHMKHLLHQQASRSKAAGVFEALVLANHMMYLVEKLAFFMVKAEIIKKENEEHKENEDLEKLEAKLKRLELAIYSSMHINYITETVTLMLESFGEAPLGTWVPSYLSLYPHKIETASYRCDLQVSSENEVNCVQLPGPSFFQKARLASNFFSAADHIFYFSQRVEKNKTTK